VVEFGDVDSRKVLGQVFGENLIHSVKACGIR
jgi:hypothetical protein